MAEKQQKDITGGKSIRPEEMITQIDKTVQNFNDQLSDALKLLQAEFDKLLSINQQLENDLVQYKQKNEKLTLERNDIEADSKKLSDLLNGELSDYKQQAETEMNDLRAQIILTGDESQQLQEKLNDAKNCVQALETENAEFSRQKEHILSEKEEISVQLTKLGQTRSKLENNHKIYIKRKTATVNKLRDENKKLKEDKKTIADQNNQLEKEFSQEKEKCKELINECEILKSGRKVLLKDLEMVDERIHNEQEQSLIDIISQLSEHLSKLSVLAGEEPQDVKGLKIETVYRDLLDWIADIFGEKPRSFPAAKECDEDGTLWLDADKEGLSVLLEKYDWSNIRPFENLPDGSRLLPFRVMRRGWLARGTILKRAKITLIDID